MLQFYISPQNNQHKPQYNIRYASPHLKNIEFAPSKNKEMMKYQLRYKHYCPSSRLNDHSLSPQNIRSPNSRYQSFSHTKDSIVVPKQ